MKIIVLIAVMFFKWSILGVPLWVSIALLAPVAVIIAYWYQRLKKRHEVEMEDEPMESAAPHSDVSDGEEGDAR
jgi:membrane protein implicated in regulation of membrane protease activity